MRNSGWQSAHPGRGMNSPIEAEFVTYRIDHLLAPKGPCAAGAPHRARPRRKRARAGGEDGETPSAMHRADSVRAPCTSGHPPRPAAATNAEVTAEAWRSTSLHPRVAVTQAQHNAPNRPVNLHSCHSEPTAKG